MLHLLNTWCSLSATVEQTRETQLAQEVGTSHPQCANNAGGMTYTITKEHGGGL